MPEKPGGKRYLSDVSTHLSIILGARNQDPKVRNPALVRFFARYELPIREEISAFSSWARRDAEDLVSEFKTGLLMKARLEGFDPELGRFRNWLKTCITNFLKSEFRKRFCPSRDPRLEVSADEVDDEGNRLIDLIAMSERRGKAFDRACTKRVVDFALDVLEKETVAGRKKSLFLELKPTLSGAEDKPGYAEIAKRLGMTEVNVKVSAHRMRKRLKEIIRQEVRESVGTKVDVDDEIRRMMSDFDEDGE